MSPIAIGLLLIVLLASLVALILAVHQAPEGYEDGSGFHAVRVPSSEGAGARAGLSLDSYDHGDQLPDNPAAAAHGMGSGFHAAG